jgi:hypothetical protein
LPLALLEHLEQARLHVTVEMAAAVVAAAAAVRRAALVATAAMASY